MSAAVKCAPISQSPRDGRGEHEDGPIFHPVHNRLSFVVAAVGARSIFRDYDHNGILPLDDRMPHEAATVELIVRHSGDGDIIAMNDGMLADVADRFALPPHAAPPASPQAKPRRRRIAPNVC